ncbi:MAG: undecaprenyl phosphate translocase family protein, partial [Verrucomicrobiales bacterium]
YLVVCGVVAICSMIIPGLSGSFVLLLMGNYMLVIGSISTLSDGLKELSFSDDLQHAIFRIMLPMGIGCVVGLVVFSHVLSWVFRRFHDIAVSLMAGFVAGSLLIIWPWKNELHLLDEAGELVLRKGEPVIQGYAWFLPAANGSTALAVLVVFLGVATVWLVEKLGAANRD